MTPAASASAPLTLGAAVAHAAATLTDHSPSPRLDAEALAMQACNLSRAELVARSHDRLTPRQRADLDAAVARRRRGEPIAYIVGRREFWSLDLIASPAALIPRPETELVVERALAHLPADRDVTVADLGTGAGGIALAVARERPRARVLAIDRSPEALALAQANARRCGSANVEFLLGDWLSPLAGTRVHVIAGNPPYVADDDPHLARGDVRFEPRAALVAGPDGLDAIRRIAADALAHLSPDGWLVLEHGWNQAAAVETVLTRHGYRSIGRFRDLAGNERVTECRRR